MGCGIGNFTLRYNSVMDNTLNLAHVARPALEKSGEGKTPGLLLLHGRGTYEGDLMDLVEVLDPRLAVVSARAPFRAGPGFSWYALSQPGYADKDTLRASVEALKEFIRNMVPAYNIDPERLYLLGFSQGAVMSAAMALTIPEQVRGVVMHSGYVPVNGGLDLRPGEIKGKPFFVAHGRYDDVIPVGLGREAYEYLSKAGADVAYQEYPIGHSISEESLYDLSEWISSHI